jgi:hypothetical protein
VNTVDSNCLADKPHFNREFTRTGRGRRRPLLRCSVCEECLRAPRSTAGIVAAQPLSPFETLLGGGSDRSDQRRNNEDQQEDHEQHRPEKEP